MDWTPYGSRNEFELAEFLFKRVQMSAGNINILLEHWARSLAIHDDSAPFSNCKDLYNTIDATRGGVSWQSFTLSARSGIQPENNVPQWMTESYTVWYRDPRLLFRNMLENSDFVNNFDHAPFREWDDKGYRRFENFMSGDWAWKQAVSVYIPSIT